MPIAIWKQKEMPIYFKKHAQVGVLLFDKPFIAVLVKHFDYSNILLVKNTTKLPKNTKMNELAIELVKDK